MLAETLHCGRFGSTDDCWVEAPEPRDHPRGTRRARGSCRQAWATLAPPEEPQAPQP
jgi:hypothetical protein